MPLPSFLEQRVRVLTHPRPPEALEKADPYCKDYILTTGHQTLSSSENENTLLPPSLPILLRKKSPHPIHL